MVSKSGACVQNISPQNPNYRINGWYLEEGSVWRNQWYNMAKHTHKFDMLIVDRNGIYFFEGRESGTKYVYAYCKYTSPGVNTCLPWIVQNGETLQVVFTRAYTRSECLPALRTSDSMEFGVRYLPRLINIAGHARKINSLVDCQKECIVDLDADCTSWSFNTQTRDCWLLETPRPPRPAKDPDFISGQILQLPMCVSTKHVWDTNTVLKVIQTSTI